VRWKNVLRLTGVYAKSSRLITKRNFRMFRESRWETYVIYGAAVVIGALLGLGAGYLYLMAPDKGIQPMLLQAIVGFFVSLPTLCILYSLFLTMMFQIQRSGVKASVLPIYWFPVTWEEHTAASVISSTLTGTLWITMFICSGVLAGSILIGLLPLAILTALGLFLCMALTGLTMEAFKAVQMGVSGAIMRAAGRSAVWVRFFAMILMFTVIYVAYFAVTQSSMITVLFKAVAEGQLTVWFVPYVWPGLALYAFSQGQWAETSLLSLVSIIFAAILFVAAARLNARYGLSDAPTISVSSTYKPGSGLLNRLGLTAVESAIVRKDFKAFTRRSELMYVFIMPIVLVVATFMPLVMSGRGSIGAMDFTGSAGTFYYLYLSLMPAPVMATMLGISVVGAEGERLWLLNASPMSVKSFVRAKFLFPAMLCTAIAVACCVAGYLIFGPTLRMAVTGVIEALLLAYTIGMAALSCGIAGADFRELPRPRMIRTEWSLAGMFLCVIVGFFVLLPILAYGGIAIFGSLLPMIGTNGAYLYVAWLLSGVIALAISYLFYRASIGYARKMLDAAE
jgi:hypothetical protein